jgi:hypothetical protein
VIESSRIEVDFLTHMDDGFLTPYQNAFKVDSKAYKVLLILVVK